jgi:hypothetical protein
VLQRTTGKIAALGPSTIDGIEIVRFCAFAPPGSTLDRRYISVHFYRGIRDEISRGTVRTTKKGLISFVPENTHAA